MTTQSTTTISQKLGLKEAVTSADDYLIETEVIRKYKKLKSVSDFYALWLSYEMLLEEENRKTRRVQRRFNDEKLRAKMLEVDAKAWEHLKLEEAQLTSEAGKKQVERHRQALERGKDFITELGKKEFAEFSIYPRLPRHAKEARVNARDFFETHWRTLTLHGCKAPHPASLKLVGEPMTSEELVDVVAILREQHESLLAKLNKEL